MIAARMNRFRLKGVSWWSCAVLLLFGEGSTGAAQPKPTDLTEMRERQLAAGVSTYCPSPGQFSLKRPDPAGTPTEVGVGLNLRDLLVVEDVDQSFRADVVLGLQWRDPRLADERRGEGLSRCVLPFDRLWRPVVAFQRLTDQLRFQEELTFLDSQGRVTQVQRLLLDVSTPFDLSDFPFDSQTLLIQLSSRFSSVAEVRFEVIEDLTGRNAALSIAGWKVGEAEARTWEEQAPFLQAELPRFEFRVQIWRLSGFFIRKLIAPLLLIVLMSWAVFWLPPRLLAPQVGLAATSMLTLIAYQFALSGFLPRISYPTRADSFILWSTVMVFLALVEAVSTGALAHLSKEQLAHRIDHTARWLFPLIFLGIVAFTLVV